MKKLAKIALAFLVVVFAAVILVMLVAPWSQLAEWQLKRTLVEKGMGDISISVDSVAPGQVVFSAIGVPGRQQVSLKRLTVDYSLEAVWKNSLNHVEGAWHIEGLAVEKLPLPLPPLSGEGAWSFADEKGVVSGTLASADNAYNAALSVTLSAEHPEWTMVDLYSAQLPWNGGTLSTKDAKISLADDRASVLTVNVKSVSLAPLMAELTGGHATATGSVSGVLPVTLGGKAGFTVRGGKLESDAPGTIALSAGLIGEGNEQLATLNTVLSDFRYERLSITLESDEQHRLAAVLSVRGNNPAFQNGRAVNLNVNLTGDVLELLQQSVFPLTDPKQLLKQE